jgi:hypothetical protein
MNPVTLALATARLTTLVTKDEITVGLRDKVDLWAGKKEYAGPRGWANYLVNCQQCVSVWAGALVLGASYVPVARPVIRALALSQAALLSLEAADHLRSTDG